MISFIKKYFALATLNILNKKLLQAVQCEIDNVTKAKDALKPCSPKCKTKEICLAKKQLSANFFFEQVRIESAKIELLKLIIKEIEEL